MQAMVMDDLYKTTEERMKKAEDALKKELASIRTGRANPGLLDHIRVEAYGQPTPLKQVGNVNVPEPRTITIQPWDKGMLGPIEKAIQRSDLGINPTNDGVLVRLVIPALTEDRRKDIVKMVHKRGEESKIALRNVRRDAMEELKKAEKGGKASEDEVKRAQDHVQKMTDRFIRDFDDILVHKEKEVMEV
jgi:ribosome recycling factor